MPVYGRIPFAPTVAILNKIGITFGKTTISAHKSVVSNSETDKEQVKWLNVGQEQLKECLIQPQQQGEKLPPQQF
jgi:xanthosine utilization system XapX-like protein